MPSIDRENEKVAKKQPFWVPLLSGAGAGAICSVLCAPLDVAKVRMQVKTCGCCAKIKRTLSVISQYLHFDLISWLEFDV